MDAWITLLVLAGIGLWLYALGRAHGRQDNLPANQHRRHFYHR